jgi:hypothetical protein
MYKCFDVPCVPVVAMYRSIEKVDNANASRLGELQKDYLIGAVGNQLKDSGRVASCNQSVDVRQRGCTVLCTDCMQGPNSYFSYGS